MSDGVFALSHKIPKGMAIESRTNIDIENKLMKIGLKIVSKTETAFVILRSFQRKHAAK